MYNLVESPENYVKPKYIRGPDGPRKKDGYILRANKGFFEIGDSDGLSVAFKMYNQTNSTIVIYLYVLGHKLYFKDGKIYKKNIYRFSTMQKNISFMLPDIQKKVLKDVL